MRSAGIALFLAAGALAAGFLLHSQRGREASFAWLAGLAFGAILQRSRFCFAAAFRDGFLLRDFRAALGVLAALALGSVGHQVVFGAQVPDPGAGWVPPTAFIARVGWHTLLGGLAFGSGMVLAGGCISGNLFRLGEGAATALSALAGALLGFALAQAAWNFLWVETIATSPVVWLPRNLGYGASTLLQLLVLATIAWLLLRKRDPSPSARDPLPLHRRIFVAGWPAWMGGIFIGVLATLTYFRGTPLGVTAELGRAALIAGRALDLAPARLEGLDQIAGCKPALEAQGLSDNGLFVLALVLGSLCAAVGAGEFRLRLGRPRTHLAALAGGLLLGFGAMIASGCTVGALLSGVMAFSLHGWVFGLGLLGGAWIASRALPRARAEALVDVRGEMCPVPALKLQGFLSEHRSREPFTVIGDHLPSLESMRAIAERAGWSCEFERRADGAWEARLRAASGHVHGDGSQRGSGEGS